ncbi:hypothetical protein ABID42_000459 [Arcicella rosea]|uniref:hypothetical protein n=1 Tax=Arcicella rosea TaxID=502909 RepID=UPI00345D008C
MKYYLIVFFSLLINHSFFSQSIVIQSGGTNWSESLSSSTITQAGADYTNNITSSSNQSLINVNGSLLTYQVSVRRQDIVWDSRLQLFIRKTGDGTGGLLATITPSGVSSYQQITTTNSNFFSGSLALLGNRVGVPIQYEIRGVSVLIPVKTYSTTIIYTVTGL